MSLKATIEADIKKAMLEKDKDALRALRGIKSMILLEETKDGASADGLSSEQEMKLLQKAAKQRKESAETYKANGRDDLAEGELLEVSIIERYLPKALSAEELEEKLKEIIAQVGAKAPSDMGKVMGAASKALAGLADNKVISERIKALLSA